MYEFYNKPKPANVGPGSTPSFPMAVPDLRYTDGKGVSREIKGCKLTVDNTGRYWLWDESQKINLAYKARSREDCLLAALDMLLFIVELKSRRIASLQRIADLAAHFADQVKPDPED